MKFLDNKSNPINNCYLKNISQIATIDLSSLNRAFKHASFKVACDVNNPLYGINGATLTFAKQKGVADKQLKDIDDNKNLDNLLGTGAAGGVGFALATFINSQLVFGAELILDTINFDNYLKNYKIVIVGEGKMDQQSLYEKIPITVAKRAKKYNVKKVITM